MTASASAAPRASIADRSPDPRRPARDERWPLVVATLAALHEAGRRSVRIVDADCGAGALLLAAVGQARRLGFTAIEGRGIDGVPALIARARAAAAAGLRDPAIGLTYEVADLVTALADETELPADLVLWHAPGRTAAADAIARAVGAAGDVVIGDPATRQPRR